MKKIVLGLSLLFALGTIANAQKAPKSTKTVKTAKALAGPKKTAKPTPIDPHAGHNHGMDAAVPPPPPPMAPANQVAMQAPQVEQPAPPPPPVITNPDEASLTLAEDNYNFGQIPQGIPVSHDFKVTNNSKGNLTIDNVVVSCGCTTPEWEKSKTIAPGQTTTIKLGFNAASVQVFSKSVTVQYNSGLSKVISFKGEVVQAAPAQSVPENKGAGVIKQ